MSKKRTKNNGSLSVNKTYSAAKDEFGEIITSPAKHDVSFASELESTSDPLKYKLYVRKNTPIDASKNNKQDEISESIFASEIKSITPLVSDSSIHDQGFSSAIPKNSLQNEILRINNLENRISGLENHIIDIGKEMNKLMEHQMNIIKAIDGLSIEIRNTKNQIAR